MRHLHVAPPPIGRLNFHLSDVIWAPNLFQDDQARVNIAVDSILRRKMKRGIDGIDDATASLAASEIQVRRRGFGLELETVQLPPARSCRSSTMTRLPAAARYAAATSPAGPDPTTMTSASSSRSRSTDM